MTEELAPIRIGLVDDDRLTRDSLKLMLQANPEVDVVWSAPGGIEAIDHTRRCLDEGTPTEIALVDINMPGMDGAEVCAALREIDPGLRVIMLTSLDPGDHLKACLRAGAQGYLLKDDAPDALGHVLKAARMGIDTFPGSAVSSLAASTPDPEEAEVRPVVANSPLTDRELEVLRAVAESLTNSQIANRLRISESTVKAHLRAIMTKLDVVDRVGMIAWAFRTGIIS